MNNSSISSSLRPFVSGTVRKMKIIARKAITAMRMNPRAGVTASSRDRKVKDTIRLKTQFVVDDAAIPKLRAHVGYISEFRVQGIGPIPGAKKAR